MSNQRRALPTGLCSRRLEGGEEHDARTGPAPAIGTISTQGGPTALTTGA